MILHYIDLAIKEMDQENSTSTDNEDSILKKLLRVDKRVAVIVVSDLMLAGVDTVSNSNYDKLMKH